MEQICFELENIEVTLLDKEIVKLDRLAIYQFDRIGIVGKNGAGKSTLLKLLAGEKVPTKGRVRRHVECGYFEQVAAPKPIIAEQSLLGKLKVPKDSQSLSGGEQTRLKLAQLFTRYHEALLIDEPTTHLDHEGISFLTDELKYYFGALVLISHDRALLDNLVTTIWEVEDGKVRVYSGNYSDYLAQKELEREQQILAREQYIKEKNRLEKVVHEKMKMAEKIAKNGNTKKEYKAKANRMFETKSKATVQKAIQRTAKAIESRINQLQEVEAVNENQPIIFRQSKHIELHNKYPIMADQLTLEVGNRVLLDKVSFQLPLGKKIAITGANGSGKSTLLNQIVNHSSDFTISPKAKIGFFRQMSYQFIEDETVLQYVKKRSDYDEGFLRTVLHSMQFVGTDLQKSVHDISGGEGIRLQLCQLFLGEYNILLLDEPTNFLDLQAIQALERFIQGYEGTIVFVTHDRKFIEIVADMEFQIVNRKLHLI